MSMPPIAPGPVSATAREQLALHQRNHWIFDMDGTLTVAAHDFDAIRRSLGLPPKMPILESMAQLPEEKAAPLRVKLHEIELDIAHRSQVQPGALALLAGLRSQNKRFALLTRNSMAGAVATLTACGLDQFFEPAFIISRHCCPPKPQPDGIHHVLGLWQAQPQTAVMVGDYVFDLLAGRNAGTATVHLDVTGAFPWPEHADAQVSSLDELAILAVGEDRRVGGDRRVGDRRRVE